MTIRKGLQSCFDKSLPGLPAQLKMAPFHRREELITPGTIDKAIKSSVLMLFYPKEGMEHIAFIKRPVYNGVHSGQIALPGGRWESTDKSLYHTALREAREEIGIDTHQVKHVGKLTDLYIPPSNYVVSPFVATYDKQQNFAPDPQEVDEILEVPFSFFLEKTSVRKIKIETSGGLVVETPCFDYKGNIIWGATAMIMSEMVIQWKSTV